MPARALASNRLRHRAAATLGVRGGRRAGFTLIEILIVIVMISMLALMALPRFADANGRRHLNSARMRFVSALATARQAAIQKGGKVSFTVQSNRITVQADGVNLISPVPLDTLYKVKATSGEATTTQTIQFDGRGFASPKLASGTYFKLTRAGVGEARVPVSPLGMAQ